MCCAVDGREHQVPLRDDGRCMHCDKVPAPGDTMGEPLPVPTKEEIEALLSKLKET